MTTNGVKNKKSVTYVVPAAASLCITVEHITATGLVVEIRNLTSQATLRYFVDKLLWNRNFLVFVAVRKADCANQA